MSRCAALAVRLLSGWAAGQAEPGGSTFLASCFAVTLQWWWGWEWRHYMCTNGRDLAVSCYSR